MKLNLVFFGTSEFAKTILMDLYEKYNIKAVVTQPDKPSGRNKKLIPSPVKKIALENLIKVYSPEKISETKDILKKIEADFFIVAAYGQFLPKDIIKLPKIKTLNVHGSILPKYRGPSPIQEVILKGEKTTGNSIMLITEKMDSGPILAQSNIPISDDDTSVTLSEKLAIDAKKLLTKTLDNYNKLAFKKQNEDLATYTKIIKKEDGRIDWRKNAVDIEREIRAYQPWPKAFTSLNHQLIHITKAKITNIKTDPGKIIIKHRRLFIGTSTTALEIINLLPSGKKEMSGQSFVNGYKFTCGQILH